MGRVITSDINYATRARALICALPLTFAVDTTFFVGVDPFGVDSPPILALNIALLLSRGAMEGGFAVEVGLGGDLLPKELCDVVREIVPGPEGADFDGVVNTPFEVDGRLERLGLETEDVKDVCDGGRESPGTLGVEGERTI